MMELLQNLINSTPVMVDLCGYDGHGDKVQLTAEGRLFPREDASLLVFDEFNPEDMTSAQSAIRFSENYVSIVRGMHTFPAMEFRTGQLCEGEYRAEGQSLILRTFPTEVSVKRRGARGRLRVVYQMTLGLLGGAIQETHICRMEIRFRPTGDAEKARSRGKRCTHPKQPDAVLADEIVSKLLQETFAQDSQP